MVLHIYLVFPGDVGDQLDSWLPSACGAHEAGSEPAWTRRDLHLGDWRNPVCHQHFPLFSGPDPSGLPYISVHSTDYYI